MLEFRMEKATYNIFVHNKNDADVNVYKYNIKYIPDVSFAHSIMYYIFLQYIF